MAIDNTFGKPLSPAGNLDFQKSFSSFGELCKYAITDWKPTRSVEDCSSRREDEDRWSGVVNFADIIPIIKQGWPKGLEMIHRLTHKYEHIFQEFFPQQDYTKEIIPDIQGEIVDIEKAVRGEPEDMLRFEDNQKLLTAGTKFQRIFVNTSYHNGITAETVFSYGALVVALINSLEGYGFRTELIARSVTATKSSSGDFCIIDTIIKQFEESSDKDKIAFAFAHPAYLRRLGFAILETIPEKLIKKYRYYNGGSYAYPANYYADIVTSTDLYFPKLENNYKFDDLAEYFITALKGHFKEDSFGA